MYKKLLAGIFMFFALIMACSVCAGAEEFGDYTYYVNEDGKTCTIFKYHGRDKAVTIPSEIDGKRVTTIGDLCFWGNDTIE